MGWLFHHSCSTVIPNSSVPVRCSGRRVPNGASVCQGSETPPPAPPCLAPAWARGTNLRRLGDFCILFCFALRCPCNCLPNPACVTFGADGAQRLCPGRLGQGLGLLLQTSVAAGSPASCCCPQLLRAELLHGEKAVPIMQGAGDGCSPQPQSRGAPRSPFIWVCVVPALPSPCPAPSPSPISLRFSALSLVSNFPSWQQFWGRDRPGSFRLFSGSRSFCTIPASPGSCGAAGDLSAPS